MNAATRYQVTTEALRASAGKRHRAELKFIEAQNAFREEEEKYKKAEERHKTATAKATAVYAQRLADQKAVMARVIEKHNMGRLPADCIELGGYRWVHTYGTLEVVRLSEKEIAVRFRQSKEQVSEEFTLSRKILHISNRELAAEVRRALKKERGRREEARRAEQIRQLQEEKRKVAASIQTEERKLAQLRREQERLAVREERLA